MKKQLSLSINNPCAEKWEGFTPTQEGGFCKSCQKNVVDYTKMSDEQVLLMIRNTSGKSCGRLRPDQLKPYNIKEPSSVRFSLKWVYSGLITILLLLVDIYGIAGQLPVRQDIEYAKLQGHAELQPKDTTDGHNVQGVVVDKGSKEALPGVNVVLKGSNVGTITDLNGFFKFPKELKEGDVLVFCFIGMQTKEYKVPKNAPETIEMPMFAMVYDITGELSIDEVYTRQTGFVRLLQKVKSVF